MEQTAGTLYTQEGLPCSSLSCGTGTVMAPLVFCFFSISAAVLSTLAEGV